MIVKQARFVKSVLKPEDFPKEGWPEVVFAGRSNVGKSTLLNALLRRKGLAKTSKTPGKTREINFFAVNEQYYFVDLPGYGYARVSKALKKTWGNAITSYLMERKTLRLAVQLIDSRHPPTQNDHELMNLLADAKVPTLLVATKFDKLKNSEQKPSLATICQHFDLDDEALIIPVSSQTGLGMKPLWRIIDEFLTSPCTREQESSTQ